MNYHAYWIILSNKSESLVFCSKIFISTALYRYQRHCSQIWIVQFILPFIFRKLRKNYLRRFFIIISTRIRLSLLFFVYSYLWFFYCLVQKNYSSFKKPLWVTFQKFSNLIAGLNVAKNSFVGESFLKNRSYTENWSQRKKIIQGIFEGPMLQLDHWKSKYMRNGKSK